MSAAKGIRSLTDLISRAAQEIYLAWGFKEDLSSFRKRLKGVEALLRDAERGRIKSEVLQGRLKSMKDATCDAENVLDELAYEGPRRKLVVQIQMRNKVHNFFSLSNPLAFHLKMAHKIKNINSNLDKICKEAKEIGLTPANQVIKNANIAALSLGAFPRNDPFLGDLEVVGIDGDESRVIDTLCSPDNNGSLPVIAIVGMPGLGKTTLAKLVYYNENVEKNFGEKKMWICVSDDFNVERLLNEMVEYLTGVKSEITNIGEIVAKLREILNEKKYLLVLDDVWNEDRTVWECMRDALRGIGAWLHG